MNRLAAWLFPALKSRAKFTAPLRGGFVPHSSLLVNLVAGSGLAPLSSAFQTDACAISATQPKNLVAGAGIAPAT